MRLVSIASALFSVSVLITPLACKKDEKAPTAAAGDKVGVPECDEYIEKYKKCLAEKMPDSAQESIQHSLNLTRDNFKKLAEDPATKAGLPMACKQALEVTKTSMKDYSCSW